MNGYTHIPGYIDDKDKGREASKPRLKYRLRRVEKERIIGFLLAEARAYLRDPVYSNYRVELRVLYKALKRVREAVERDGYATTHNTYIHPSMLYLIKQLVLGKTTIYEVLARIKATRLLVRRLFKTLARDYGLKLYVPSNVAGKVKVHAWSDYLGETMDGRKLLALTLWFQFPFDIYEYDGRSEYEPVTFVFSMRNGVLRLERVYSRIHYDVYEYVPQELGDVKVLFAGSGHTPIILDAKVYSTHKGLNLIGVGKTALDYLWLRIAPVLTKLSGVEKIDVVRDRRRVQLYVDPVLLLTKNNPFPYLLDVRI